MNITAQSLRRAADIKDKIENLKAELETILGGGGGNGVPSPLRGRPPGKRRRKMSAAARAKIAAAARARWAKVKAAGKKSL